MKTKRSEVRLGAGLDAETGRLKRCPLELRVPWIEGAGFELPEERLAELVDGSPLALAPDELHEHLTPRERRLADQGAEWCAELGVWL